MGVLDRFKKIQLFVQSDMIFTGVLDAIKSMASLIVSGETLIQQKAAITTPEDIEGLLEAYHNQEESLGRFSSMVLDFDDILGSQDGAPEGGLLPDKRIVKDRSQLVRWATELAAETQEKTS